jgi:hypothetical protein
VAACSTVLGFAAPGASASVAERFVPVYDAAHGVNARMGKDTVQVTFGPKAAKLYKTFAGHKVSLGCGRHNEPETPDADGTIRSGGGSSFDPNTGRMVMDGSGYLWTEKRFPRRRGRVDFGFAGDPYDVCFVATKVGRNDDECLPLVRESPIGIGENLCVRMIATLTDAGRAMIDERSRLIELELVEDAGDTSLAEFQHYFGEDVVALDSPDATPPLGKVGIFRNGTTTATVVLLADGRRLFVRHDGEVYSTNVSAFSGGDESVFSLT